MAARIDCTDDLGNTSYIHHTPSRGWCCTLSNGTPASMFYAGVSNEMLCRFALEDAQTADECLAAVKRHGSRRYSYVLL